MSAQRWGRVVTISSISALGDDERVNYVAAKAGLEGLTRAAALDLAPTASPSTPWGQVSSRQQ